VPVRHIGGAGGQPDDVGVIGPTAGLLPSDVVKPSLRRARRVGFWYNAEAARNPDRAFISSM
jgi:hypothetical protein